MASDALKLTIPSAKDQRGIIAALETEDESLHVYAVTKTWYETWRTYVGLDNSTDTAAAAPPAKDSGKCVLAPGELEMSAVVEDDNMYVDERIWRQWVEWYGVADSHEMDRRNWASDEKDFEICVLSGYSGILVNPAKTFDISEETGYIEMQLRRIFKVAEYRKSRLWSCEKSRHARFHLLLDRTKEICYQDAIDVKKSYILALEIANMDGTWGSHNPGVAIGSFEKYSLLIGRPRSDDYWEKELTKTLESVYSGISHELSETINGIVTTTKCVSTQREKDVDYIREKLETRIRGVEEVQRTLNKKAKDIIAEDEHVKTEVRRLRRDREHLEQERTKFTEELKRMEEMNKTQESKVKLNIGGVIYVTSTLTLVKDEKSMLAAMFSGRHSLKKEEDGSYFIDRDGTHFRFVLNFLRDGGFREGAMPTDRAFLNELLTEAEFYQVTGLVKLITDMLRFGKANGSDDEAGQPTSPKPERRHHGSKRPHRKVAVIK